MTMSNLLFLLMNMHTKWVVGFNRNQGATKHNNTIDTRKKSYCQIQFFTFTKTYIDMKYV